MCHIHGQAASEALAVGIELEIEEEKECHDRCHMGAGISSLVRHHLETSGKKGSRDFVEYGDRGKGTLSSIVSVTQFYILI